MRLRRKPSGGAKMWYPVIAQRSGYKSPVVYVATERCPSCCPKTSVSSPSIVNVYVVRGSSTFVLMPIAESPSEIANGDCVACGTGEIETWPDADAACKPLLKMRARLKFPKRLPSCGYGGGDGVSTSSPWKARGSYVRNESANSLSLGMLPPVGLTPGAMS